MVATTRATTKTTTTTVTTTKTTTANTMPQSEASSNADMLGNHQTKDEGRGNNDGENGLIQELWRETRDGQQHLTCR